MLSLPLTQAQRFFITIIELIFNNLFILLPLIASVYVSVGDNKGYELNIFIVRLCSLIMLMICSQAIFNKLNYKKAFILLFLNILFTSIGYIKSYMAQITFLFVYIAYVYQILLIHSKQWAMSTSNDFVYRAINFDHNLRDLLSNNIWSIIKVEIKQLYKFNHISFIMFALLTWLLLLFGYMFSAYAVDSEYYLFILFITNYFIAFLLSGFFYKLTIMRNNYKKYLISLPVSYVGLFIRDIFITAIANLLYLLLLTIMLVFHYRVKLSIISLEYFLSLLFLIFSYYPQTKYKLYGQIISLVIMVFFIAINHYLFNFLGIK